MLKLVRSAGAIALRASSAVSSNDHHLVASTTAAASFPLQPGRARCGCNYGVAAWSVRRRGYATLKTTPPSPAPAAVSSSEGEQDGLNDDDDKDELVSETSSSPATVPSFPSKPRPPKGQRPPSQLPASIKRIRHHSEGHAVLNLLAHQPHLLSLKNHELHLLPALALLLEVRHYAGAREIIEALFERVYLFYTGRSRLSAPQLNELLTFILGQPNVSERMSVAAIDSYITYILHQVALNHDQTCIDLQTIRILTYHPHYLSLPNLRRIVNYFTHPHIKAQIDCDFGIWDDSEGLSQLEKRQRIRGYLQILHGISRAYSLHGQTELTGQWMQLVLETEEKRLRMEKEYRQRIRVQFESLGLEANEIIRRSITAYQQEEKRMLDDAKRKLDIGSARLTAARFLDADSLTDQPSSKQAISPRAPYNASAANLVGTSFIAAFGRTASTRFAEHQAPEAAASDKADPALLPSPAALQTPTLSTGASASAGTGTGTGVSRLVDSSGAMSFFDALRAHHAAKTVPGKLEQQRLRKVGIYGWTAMLSVASKDVSRVDSRALCDVFTHLRSEGEPPNLTYTLSPPLSDGVTNRFRCPAYLPDPNIVTYTVLMSGLMLRGENRSAVDIFETEVVPLVQRGLLQLDNVALQEYINAYVRLGQIDKAGEIMRWFAVKTEPVPPAIAGSTDVRAAAAVGGGTLESTVQLDVGIINNYLTHLARHGLFASLFRLYTEMDRVYGVTPDEVTLAVLAKAAISHAVRKERGGSGVPSHSEDAFHAHAAERRVAFSEQRMRDELHAWDGQAPAAYLRKMFWTVLEENYPVAARRAADSQLGTAKRFLLGLRKHVWSPVAARTHALPAADIARARQAPYTPLAYPHLCPSPANMHLFIALLGYFSASSEIPLVLAFMRELNQVPSRRTLCLALWSYEEGGAYGRDREKLEKWLLAWLGPYKIPGDLEVAAFRRNQWGESQFPPGTEAMEAHTGADRNGERNLGAATM